MHKTLSIYRKTQFGDDTGFWKLVMKSLFDQNQITPEEREFVCINRVVLFLLFALVYLVVGKYHDLIIVKQYRFVLKNSYHPKII